MNNLTDFPVYTFPVYTSLPLMQYIYGFFPDSRIIHWDSGLMALNRHFQSYALPLKTLIIHVKRNLAISGVQVV